MMSEILLAGLAVVVIYFIAHHATMALERSAARPLGAWRTAAFFVVFLALLLLAMVIRGWMGGPVDGGG